VNYRLFLLHGESKYYDVLERSLYNGLISGVSLEGNGFFYPNPLESMGQHQRQAWFGCACCPSNICRFIPSLPGYIYAVRDRNVYVNLFLANKSTLNVGKKKVGLSQVTNYPWDGDITLTIDKSNAGEFTMKIRIPGWVRGQVVPSDLYQYTDNKRLGYKITVNGKEVTPEKAANASPLSLHSSLTTDGYLSITRRWKKGDKIQIHFDMEPRTVRANHKVQADRGMTAVERGPLVYCAEHPDNDFDVMSALLNQAPQFQLGRKEIAGTQVVTLATDAQSLDFSKEGRLVARNRQLTLIPYYAWCHRGSGKMRVWLAQDLSATTPAQPATLASESQVTSSMRLPALSAVNDRLIPKGENDRSVPYTHWWPEKASTQWIAYTFPEVATVSSTTVYWFSDKPWGGCAVPKSWRLLYQTKDGQWLPVEDASAYTTHAGVANTVQFKPIQTTALRLEVTLPDNDSAGLFEWSVK